MTKSFSTTFMLTAVVYFILGLAMVIWPDASRLVICYAAGILLVLYGIVRVLMQWSSSGFLSLGNGYLAGLLCLLLGILLIVKTDAVLSILGTVLGLAVIADSVIKLQISYQLRKSSTGSYQRNAICALVMLIAGIVMLFNPFAGVRAMTIFTGIILLLDAAMDFIIALDVRRHLHDTVIVVE